MEVSSRDDASVDAIAQESKRPQKKHLEDPHDIYARFVKTHLESFDTALREIQKGRKCSCWMWYIFPTPPFIVNGQERGSWTNQHYSLRTDEQATAYLKWTYRVNLRDNYFKIATATRDQLQGGNNVFSLFGGLDAPKLKSSVIYFHKIANQIGDQELEDVCKEIIDLFALKQNEKPTYKWNHKKDTTSSSSSSEEKEEQKDTENVAPLKTENEESTTLNTEPKNESHQEKNENEAASPKEHKGNEVETQENEAEPQDKENEAEPQEKGNEAITQEKGNEAEPQEKENKHDSFEENGQERTSQNEDIASSEAAKNSPISEQSVI